MAQSSRDPIIRDMGGASSRGRTVRRRAGNSAASSRARLLSGDPNVAEDTIKQVRPDSSTLRTPNLQLVQEPAVDALLNANPFALLVGMLLDPSRCRWRPPSPGRRRSPIGWVALDAGDIDHDPDNRRTVLGKACYTPISGPSMGQTQPGARADRGPLRRGCGQTGTAGEPDGTSCCGGLVTRFGGAGRRGIFLALLGKRTE